MDKVKSYDDFKKALGGGETKMLSDTLGQFEKGLKKIYDKGDIGIVHDWYIGDIGQSIECVINNIKAHYPQQMKNTYYTYDINYRQEVYIVIHNVICTARPSEH